MKYTTSCQKPRYMRLFFSRMMKIPSHHAVTNHAGCRVYRSPFLREKNKPKNQERKISPDRQISRLQERAASALPHFTGTFLFFIFCFFREDRRLIYPRRG